MCIVVYVLEFTNSDYHMSRSVYIAAKVRCAYYSLCFMLPAHCVRANGHDKHKCSAAAKRNVLNICLIQSVYKSLVSV